MRYNSALGNPKYDPSVMPSGDISTLGLTGDISPTAPIMSEPRPYNPGIKPSGAPVNFNPRAQTNMTGMFGMPTDGSYDRTMAAPVNPSTTNNQTY